MMVRYCVNIYMAQLLRQRCLTIIQYQRVLLVDKQVIVMSEDENASTIHPPIPKQASVILSTLHGRKRREERGISKAAFHAAIKFGEKTPGETDTRTGEKRWIFNYKDGGITVITNENYTKEVTSWAHPCWGLNVEKVLITEEMLVEHHQAVRNSSQHELWNSHSVVVVDQSGSMRKTDAENGVTRSDLVWLCLAVDFVGRRLRTGEATNRDYFSLVELQLNVPKGSFCQIRKGNAFSTWYSLLMERRVIILLEVWCLDLTVQQDTMCRQFIVTLLPLRVSLDLVWLLEPLLWVMGGMTH
mmetsp:Transcript_9951/g.17432  ORF Transcript_9951/g.17432 Transcript_9951/m.17432 type:complete len:300 (-) Transcript_9951:878-1777(-)